MQAFGSSCSLRLLPVKTPNPPFNLTFSGPAAYKRKVTQSVGYPKGFRLVTSPKSFAEPRLRTASSEPLRASDLH
jgi:hypothetical protein